MLSSSVSTPRTRAEAPLRRGGPCATGALPEMRDLLAPWTVRAVTSYPQVLDRAQEAGMLSAADVSRLLRFYADPRRHRWHSCPEARTALSGAI